MADRSTRAVAGVIAATELHLAALSDGDHATGVSDTIRRATTVADVQPADRYTSVDAAILHLAETDDVADAIDDLLSSPQTTTAVRKLVALVIDAADQLAARWSQ